MSRPTRCLNALLDKVATDIGEAQRMVRLPRTLRRSIVQMRAGTRRSIDGLGGVSLIAGDRHQFGGAARQLRQSSFLVGPTVSAAYAPRSPMGRSAPAVVSCSVWRSSSAFMAAPKRTA